MTDERIIKELKDNFPGFNAITHFRMPPVDPEEEDTSYLAASIFPSWLYAHNVGIFTTSMTLNNQEIALERIEA